MEPEVESSEEIEAALLAMTALERIEYQDTLDALAAKQLETVGSSIVLDYLFPLQKGLANDPHRFITACCGRRGGKTVAAAAMMLMAALDHPKRAVIYATLTRSNAKIIIWPTLKELNTYFALGGAVNEADLTITMPNGAVIVLVGVDTKSEIEKRRGFGIALFVLDECQSVPEHVKELIDNVVAPALADVRGKLVMIGTPAMLQAGYWFDCHHNPAKVWGHHHWTMWDNPHMPSPDVTLAEELERLGLKEATASIKREWFAQWVRDILSAVFSFNEHLNVYDREATGNWKVPTIDVAQHLWQYVISVDLGGGVERDNDAIGVFAFHPHRRATWLIHEEVSAKDDVTGVSEKVKALYRDLGERKVVAVVVDTGGIGAKVALEMSRRHGIPTEAAKKQDKWANIEVLNAACRKGEFFAFKGSKFSEMATKVEKDWSKSTPEKIAIKGHMPDVCDMTIYGYVESFSWFGKLPQDAPAPGSDAAVELERKRLFQLVQRQVEEQKQQVQGGGASAWGADGVDNTFGEGIEW